MSFYQMHSLSAKLTDHQKSPRVLFYKDLSILLNRKPYTRSIKLKVIPSGSIICYANQRAKTSEIMAFISSHRTWIHKQVSKLQKLAWMYPNMYWSPNTQVPLLGKLKPLKIIFGSAKKIIVHSDAMEVHLPHFRVSQAEWSELFKQHYKRLGIHVLQSRLKKWSEKMSLSAQKVTFKKYKAQWGSCSHDGNICLNWKLIVAPLCVIDYVVIHELSHLKHHNHSALFWNLVNNYSKRTQECRRWLKRNQFAFDFLEDIPELHASILP